MFRKAQPTAPPACLSDYDRTRMELMEIRKQADLAVNGTLALMIVGVVMFLVLVGLITLFRAVA